MSEPHVLRIPLVAYRPLIDTGTPWSGGSVEGLAAQQAGRPARFGQRRFPRDGDVSVDRGVHGVDPGEHGLHDFKWRDPASAVQPRELGRRDEADVVADCVHRAHTPATTGEGRKKPGRRLNTSQRVSHSTGPTVK